MVDISADVKGKLDRAYENISPHDPTRPAEEVASRAAVVQINLTEALLLGTSEAQQRLTTSLDALTAATSASNTRLTFWTKVMAIATGVLALFTFLQVLLLVMARYSGTR